MITTIVNVGSTPISFWAIEKFGRRSLLVWGAIAMCVCELAIAIVGVSAPNSLAADYCLVTFVCIYVRYPLPPAKERKKKKSCLFSADNFQVACFASTWGPTACE